MFCEKELQNSNQKQFRIEKVIKGKGNKLYVKWKGHNDSFNSWIDKKDVVIWLSNYATKSDFRKAIGVDTLQFAKKDDLANLKSEVGKVDIDKQFEK